MKDFSPRKFNRGDEQVFQTCRHVHKCTKCDGGTPTGNGFSEEVAAVIMALKVGYSCADGDTLS